MTAPRPTTPETLPEFSLVIPAYNEAVRLGARLPEVMAWLDGMGRTYEVVVVDDGSRDGTADVAKACANGRALRVLRNDPNRGKGNAIRRGMLEARGQVRLFSDADFSTPIEEALRLVEKIEAGAGVAIGSRALPESDLAVRQPFFRELSGRAFNFLVRMLLLPGIHDTQCGFKAFRSDVASTVFENMELDGFAFDVEALALAHRAGHTIVEVPVRWVNDPASKVSMLRGLQSFVDVVRLWWRAPKPGRRG